MKDDNFDNDPLNEQTMEETDDSNIQDSLNTNSQTSTSNEKDNIYVNKIIP